MVDFVVAVGVPLAFLAGAFVYLRVHAPQASARFVARQGRHPRPLPTWVNPAALVVCTGLAAWDLVRGHDATGAWLLLCAGSSARDMRRRRRTRQAVAAGAEASISRRVA